MALGQGHAGGQDLEPPNFAVSPLQSTLGVREAGCQTSATCLTPSDLSMALGLRWVSNQGGLAFSELANPRWAAVRPWD